MPHATECEICRFVFRPADDDGERSVRCPVCGIATDRQRTPREEEEDSPGNRGFWIYMFLTTGVFLFCCAGAIFMSWRIRGAS